MTLSGLYASLALLNASAEILDGAFDLRGSGPKAHLLWSAHLPPAIRLPQNSTVQRISLAGEEANCSCEHRWLSRGTLDEELAGSLLTWDPESGVRLLTAEDRMPQPKLSQRLLLGLPSPKRPLACPELECPPTPTLSVAKSEDGQGFTCSARSVEFGCLMAAVVPFAPQGGGADKAGEAQGDARPSKATCGIGPSLTLPKAPGWLLCRFAPDRDEVLPVMSALRVRPSTWPSLSLRHQSLQHSTKLVLLELSAPSLSPSAPLAPLLSWWYLVPGTGEMWEIFPRDGPKGIVVSFPQPPSPMRALREGWTRRRFVALFPRTEVNCNFGLFALSACVRKGRCAIEVFRVRSSYPSACAKKNVTFETGRVFGMPEWLHNASLDFPVDGDGDGQPAGDPDQRRLDQHEHRFRALVVEQSEVEEGGAEKGILAVVLGLVFCAVAFLLLGSCLRRRLNRHKLLAAPPQSEEMELGSQVRWARNNIYASWLYELRRKKVVRILALQSLWSERELGQGAFGRVSLVSLSDAAAADDVAKTLPRRMALKQLKFIDEERLEDLEREAAVLASLEHPNIVRFLALTLKEPATSTATLEPRNSSILGSSSSRLQFPDAAPKPPAPLPVATSGGNRLGLGLLFEFMENGDLVSFLRDHNPHMSRCQEPRLDLSDLFHMALNAAAGLEYLAEHHLVHRDLAARNCLVGSDLRVKLSDFGMSRDIYVTDYYRMGKNSLVPLRWLPPESLLFRRFTLESDIWSFGVLLWEIFSYGQVPWSALSNGEVLEAVKEGERLECPDLCPPLVFQRLIQPCWRSEPEERPKAQEAREVLESIIDESSLYVELVHEPTPPPTPPPREPSPSALRPLDDTSPPHSDPLLPQPPPPKAPRGGVCRKVSVAAAEALRKRKSSAGALSRVRARFRISEDAPHEASTASLPRSEESDRPATSLPRPTTTPGRILSLQWKNKKPRGQETKKPSA